MIIGSLIIALCEELDLGDTSFSFCSNASSTVRKQSYYFNHIADSAAKVTVDGTDDQSHVFQSVIIGDQGPYIPFPSHSILTPFGPTAWMLMLDCRCGYYNSR